VTVGTMTAVERVRAAFARIEEVERPEIWITLRPMADVLADAAAVDARSSLPLAGTVVAVKDNLDVAGLPTTAGCPAFAYVPSETAPAVVRLQEAGAVVLGKTNLDQFATGLVGTRSPHGAVRDARRPEYVSGGSSSGSAVAVVLGIADVGIGTDTAGSGRVPAAFGGIVGVKPTRGLLPNRGSIPACRTLDCITTFGRDLASAARAAAIMAGPDGGDPTSRTWPSDAPLGAPLRPRVGVPGELPGLTPEATAAFAAAAERLAAAGAEVVALDPQPFLDAGGLLYDGAFVAERHAAVGAFVREHPEEVDPTVGAIISAAGELAAHDLVADGERLGHLRLAAEEAMAALDAILLPTTTAQPTIAEVAADPVGANARLGLFTNCANLLDLCAVAVPAGEADGGQFGVSVLAPAFADRVAADVAGLLLGEPAPADGLGPGGVELLVVGAHRTGQPLNHELTTRGARFAAVVSTAPEYRLHALRTTPPKPGLVRVASGGVPIEGELWALSPAALGEFLAALPGPMALGRALLEDGREVVGFTCETAALRGAPDISEHGSWPAYLRATSGSDV
jgi:allophanate hydrolase